MYEGLKNGKNDYKWRFVLNRCAPTFFVEKLVEKEYNQYRVRFQRLIDELGG